MRWFSKPLPPEHPLSDFAPGQPVCVRASRRAAAIEKGEAFRVTGFIEVEGEKWIRLTSSTRELALRPSDLVFPHEC
jgi:hypothetical protein